MRPVRHARAARHPRRRRQPAARDRRAASRRAADAVHIVVHRRRGRSRPRALSAHQGQLGADRPHGARAARRRRARELVIVGSRAAARSCRASSPTSASSATCPRIARVAAAGGDDGVLRGVVRFFESKGFEVVGARRGGAGPAGRPRAASAPCSAERARDASTSRAASTSCARSARSTSARRWSSRRRRARRHRGRRGHRRHAARALALQRRLRRGGVGPRRGVLVKRPKPRPGDARRPAGHRPRTVTRARRPGLRGIAVLSRAPCWRWTAPSSCAAPMRGGLFVARRR